MATLKVEDFQEQNTLSVSDLASEVESGVPVNRRSAAQLAATDNLLEVPNVDQFRATRESIENPKTRGDFLIKQREIDGILAEDAQDEAVNIIADDNISDEVRQSVLDNVNGTFTNPNKSKTRGADILAEELSVTDSGTNESEQSSESRSFLVDVIKENNKAKRNMSTKINSLAVFKDQTTVGNIIDVAEIMTPFAEWIHYDRLANTMGLDPNDYILLGELKQAVFDQGKGMTVEQRAQAVESAIKLVEGSDTVILPDGNDLVSLETLNQMFVHNDYSNAERWFDNVTSVLDVLGGVGSVLRTAVVTKRAEKLRDTVKNVDDRLHQIRVRDELKASGSPQMQLESMDLDIDRAARSKTVKSEVTPTSPVQVAKDHNPEAARAMNETIADDLTGEAAEALAGTTREDALADVVLPDPGPAKGNKADRIPNKVALKRPEAELPEHIKKANKANGNTAVTDVEFDTVKVKLIDSFENVEGMRLQKNSLVVRTAEDGHISVTGRYSPFDSGHRTAAAALENARFAFRDFGIPEEAYTIYARQGTEWVETTQAEIAAKAALREGFTKAKKKIPADLKDIDYSVGIDFNYRFRPEDLRVEDLFNTGNILTRMLDSVTTNFLSKRGQGSPVQNLLPPSDVIAPQIVNPAAVAVDRAVGLKALYVKEFQKFVDKFKKFDKQTRDRLTSYIHEANFEELPFDVTDLRARGFGDEEIANLKEWRRSNDIMWHAANDDLVKSYVNRGMKVFEHKGSNTRLFGRPINRNTAISETHIFDPVDDVVRTDVDVRKLYDDDGGMLVKLEEPALIDGKWIDTVVSRETPTGGYVRAFIEDETVLTYRDGYYPVSYDSNWFVEMAITRANGTKGTKVIGSSKTLEESRHLIKQLKQTQDPAIEYLPPRPDRRTTIGRAELFDEGAAKLFANSGLTAQKIRGERLLDGGVDLHKVGRSNLKDPLEAVADQIRQLSDRVAMRTVIDTFKERWLQNYGDLLKLPIDQNTGKIRYPSSIDEIVGTSDTPRGIAADARTNFNYIYSIENGYISGIDNVIKGAFNSAAEAFAKAGFKGSTILERGAFAAAKFSPIQRAKTETFRFLIAAAAPRQALIQRGQILQLGAIDPGYTFGALGWDMINLNLVRTGLSKNPKYVALFEEVKSSGIIEAVSAHSLIRDDTLRLADLTLAQKVQTAIGAPIRGLQRVGFDFAEQDVLLSSWLTHRRKALRDGKNIKSQRVKDEILGQSRAFTLTMNRAGDMPYSHNTFGLAGQFLSFSHKAMSQGITNKSLSVRQRAALLAYSTAVFGFDAGLVKVGYDWLFADEAPTEFRDVIEDGLLHTFMNAMLTKLSGEEQTIDWGDLAPADAYGMGNMFFGMLDTPLSEIISESPAGSMLFGRSPRVTDAFRTGLRYFNVIDDYDDPLLETRYTDVIRSTLSIFSGFSSAFKANYALKTKQKLSTSGTITDDDVTTIEAMVQVFGLRTEKEEGDRLAKEQLFKDKSFDDSDVHQWYDELKRHLSRRGDRAVENEFSQRVLAEAWRVFGEDRPRTLNVIRSRIVSDAKAGDFKMWEGLSKQMGLMKDEDMWKIINRMSDSPLRKKLIKVQQAKEEMINGD